jgi:hypothetical protein
MGRAGIYLDCSVSYCLTVITSNIFLVPISEDVGIVRKLCIDNFLFSFITEKVQNMIDSQKVQQLSECETICHKRYFQGLHKTDFCASLKKEQFSTRTDFSILFERSSSMTLR